MNTARRFGSITNEGAIRPHENAFARWSSHDFGNGNGVPTLDGSVEMSPWPSAPMFSRDAAPTERQDSFPGASFTVYTAEQVRATPYRKSMPAYEEVRGEEGVGARTLLKWMGIGIVAGLAVLTALIIVLNFGGDRAFASINARSALQQPAAAPVQVQAKPVEAARPTVVEQKPVAKASVAVVSKKKK